MHAHTHIHIIYKIAAHLMTVMNDKINMKNWVHKPNLARGDIAELVELRSCNWVIETKHFKPIYARHKCYC